MYHKKSNLILSGIFIAAFAFSALGCKKDSTKQQPVEQVKSSAKQITSFSFLKANNMGLSADVTGTISGNTITLNTPFGASLTLVATFESSAKAKVYIGSTLQTSGTTSNNFTTEQSYKVVAEDNTETTYKVIVQPGKSAQKDLLTFAFLKANNSALTADITTTIADNKIAVTLPAGVSLTALKPTFTVSEKAAVLVGANAQTSGVSAVDFTNPVTYTIKAEDASTKDYTVTVTSEVVMSLAAVDDQVSTFMARYSIPALSIAITKDEKLVYVKSYGLSDKEQNTKATNQDLYRLASLSKQITSIAIMKLLDQGKINLDAKVFGAGGILGTEYGTQPYKTGITDITVSQLLHHTSGGWANDGNDPMFSNPTMTAQQLITWTLDNRPLSNTPGTKYAYSNFGYCILGRVIEKITGQTYEAAVKSLILQPIGITDMAIAGNTLAERLPNEVKYYGQSGENPYIYNIKRMDAHGGWVATATDLARLLVYIDNFPNRHDILSANAIAKMITVSSANNNYACGWAINGGNWFHTGSLPGTATEQARTSGGYNFVILTNTRS
ncbi:MAG: serine hydrolase, partial [Mucilaginibacter sp.]|nr:serine hydrolase [Mucilaginibacter sp.]